MENKIDDLSKQLFKTQESDGEFCIRGYNFTLTSEARKIIMNCLQANRHEVVVRASEPTANGAVADRIILKRIKANEVGLRCAGCFFDSEDHHCQAFLLKPDNEELVKCLGKKEGEGNYIYIPE